MPGFPRVLVLARTVFLSVAAVVLAGHCKSGEVCAPVLPGGQAICSPCVPEATECSHIPDDQCCSSDGCPNGGRCYLSTSLPQCVGPPTGTQNVCIRDACETDTDCATDGSKICAPACLSGYPARVCLFAFCRADKDCKAHPGGTCVPIPQPCCKQPFALACAYPSVCGPGVGCPDLMECQVVDFSTGELACGEIQPCPA